jgi:hypothetical protein
MDPLQTNWSMPSGVGMGANAGACTPVAGPSAVSTKLAGMMRHGARFSAEIYTRGCHWIPRLLA